MRVVTLLFLVALSRLDGGATEARPNIIFLLADDLGWRDLACTGNPWHRTPNLDRLRSQGMLFTEAHSAAPICSASRAALLTGQSPARLHYEFVPKSGPGRPSAKHLLRSPDYPTELPSGTPTIASLLSSNGYRTAFLGKWHLNRHHDHYLGWLPEHGPESFGFQACIDSFGAHPYGYPNPKNPPASLQPGEFPPDRLTDQAIGLLQRENQRPLLLWMSYYQVHDPFHSRCQSRVDFYQSILPQGASRERAHYAAMVETLDHEVGRLLDALERSGHADDTLVVFTSDNGGHPEVASNAPLRGSKWNLCQGGLRVPMIIRWPGRIAAASSCAAPVIGTDLLPTLMESAGLPSRKLLDGRSLVPLFEGKVDPSWSQRPLAWHFPFYHPEEKFSSAKPRIGVDDFTVQQVRPHAAIRLGDKKLIHYFESGDRELYDLRDDPSERNNLAAAEPASAEDLDQKLLDLLKEQDARLPTRSP